MKKIIIALPSLSLNGGNLISLKLAKLLVDNGYEVTCTDGFRVYRPNEVVLIPQVKGSYNTCRNVVSFLLISLRALFNPKQFIATHHLTCLFNFISPVSCVFIQDFESRFYPDRLSHIGNLLWKNYLRAKQFIFTNKLLEKEVLGTEFTKSNGFPYDLMNDFSYSERRYDFLLVLKDGVYKNPDDTIRTFYRLKRDGFSVALVNVSTIKMEGEDIYSNMLREDFLLLLKSTQSFVCLSNWEGLGLPNLEAYELGLSIYSTHIPSSCLLQELEPDSINLIDDVDCFMENPVNVFEGFSLPRENRKELLSKSNLAWEKYVLEIVSSRL